MAEDRDKSKDEPRLTMGRSGPSLHLTWTNVGWGLAVVGWAAVTALYLYGRTAAADNWREHADLRKTDEAMAQDVAAVKGKLDGIQSEVQATHENLRTFMRALGIPATRP